MPADVTQELEALRGERDAVSAELERYTTLLGKRERELAARETEITQRGV